MLCEPQNRNRKVSRFGIVILLTKALKIFFFYRSKSSIMDAANLQRKFPFPFSYGKKFPTDKKQSNQSPVDSRPKLKDSRLIDVSSLIG